MMLPVTGPTSSLMEDLGDLGLIEGQSQNLAEANDAPSAKSNAKGSGYAKADTQGGDYAGPNDGQEGPHYKEGDYMISAGDTAGGTRFNVGVRSGGLDRQEVGPNAQNPAKAEDEEFDGEEFVESSTAKMVPSFLIPTEEEVAEAVEEDAALAEERMLASAWDTINTYFAEDNDGLNEEGLRGVINAMGYALNVAVEDIAGLAEDNDRLSEAVHELTGLLNEEDEDEDDDEARDDDDEDEDEGKSLPPWMKKGKKQEESTSYRANLTESYDDYSLLDELRNLGEDRAIKAVDTQAKLIEGFESCRDACDEIVGRIAGVMAEDQGVTESEDLVVDEDDERVQLARFFESIAADADAYLGRMSDGDVPFRVAEADLSKLYGDMERGIEQMHTVE